jgi:hypothetical protein
MVTYEKSIFINRPQQEVFGFLSNPANHSEYSNMAESAEWISQAPHGVGSTYHGVGKALGRKMESTKESPRSTSVIVPRAWIAHQGQREQANNSLERIGDSAS